MNWLKPDTRTCASKSCPTCRETWILTVTGKRNKTREVPLNPEVVELLARHGKEFLEEDNAVQRQGQPALDPHAQRVGSAMDARAGG
jgi:hypothetical protein